MTSRSTTRFTALALVIVLVLSGCHLKSRVTYLASDELNGRNNNTPGGVAARQFIIDELKGVADGAIYGAHGDAAYLQTFPQGANILAVIEGTTRPDEYVIVGAHYDHVSSCGTVDGDSICNGATDNAAGVGIVLGLADRFTEHRPDRSIVFALWDAEEDGLVGSRYYTDNPVFPLDQTVAYLNFDIQGSRLLPSLAQVTFGLGAESGGPDLEAALADIYSWSALDGIRLSVIFGQGRSDHAPFMAHEVPAVFFTDSNGPCYHRPGDDVDVVDWDKLRAQMDVGHALAKALVNEDPGAPGSFLTPEWTPTPLVTYHDATQILDLVERALADQDRFPASIVDTVTGHRDALAALVDQGPETFDQGGPLTVVQAAAYMVNSVLTYGPCDGFLD